MVTVRVDETAPPLVERLELDVEVDDDLILHLAAASSQKADRADASYFDLEFGIGLPGSSDLGPVDAEVSIGGPETGGLVVRANVSDQIDYSAVPGDILYQHKPNAFARLPNRHNATELQRTEYLYSKPCAICKRKWGDPECRCASVA
jgi:hypothetical protein